MGFFKTEEEKQRERELERRIEELDRFPGSLEEYNSLKGEDYMIMDTGRPKKFVRIDGVNYKENPLLQEIISQGCIGFIRYIPVSGNGNGGLNGGHGIPVKRK